MKIRINGWMRRVFWRGGYVRFVDCQGREIRLRGDLSVEDLVRMGLEDMRFVAREEPLPPGYWRSVPEGGEEEVLEDEKQQEGQPKPEKQDVAGAGHEGTIPRKSGEHNE